MRSSIWIFVFLCALPVKGETTVEIGGRVRVTAKLTRRRISLPQVYERNAAIAPAAVTRVDEWEELRRVVIYLDTAALPSHPKTLVMDQRQRHFEPEFVVVPVGSVVKFLNSDPIFHNVFSLSKVKAFDLGNYAAGDSRTVIFSQPGLVQVHCHLHTNMSGAVLVTPNDWFTELDAAGNFALPPVPPGRYTVVAWHKSAGYFRRRVEVAPGRTPALDFEIPIAEGVNH